MKAPSYFGIDFTRRIGRFSGKSNPPASAGGGLVDLGGLHYELEELLGCSVDVVTEKTLKDRIRQWVMNEAVLL